MLPKKKLKTKEEVYADIPQHIKTKNSKYAIKSACQKGISNTSEIYNGRTNFKLQYFHIEKECYISGTIMNKKGMD